MSIAESDLRDFTYFGWRRPPYKEPLVREGEKPKRFEHLTFRALVEGAISEVKEAELLGISVQELNQRMEKPPADEPKEAEE